MQDLIRRLQRAMMADRSLDAEISRVIFGGSSTRVTGDSVLIFGSGGVVIAKDKANYYTLSLESALTLVEAGKEWSVDNIEGYRAHVMWEHTPQEFISRSGKGATAAIAVCIAALRARTTTPGEG
jgi:hypothetical protein